MHAMDFATYFAKAVSHTCKMFMNPTTGVILSSFKEFQHSGVTLTVPK
jgi:hypothetical protein